MSDDLRLALPFDRDTTDFARGVEVGLVWAQLHADPMPQTFLMHADNSEMALRIAEALGVQVTATYVDDDWSSVTFTY